jgi:hypothetical protein
MFEYASVSASAYDTTSLVAKINEQASSGWEVVAIVATGGDVTAFLKREATDEGSTNGDVAVADIAVAEVVAVSEPAGWGAEPTPEPEPVPQDIAPETVIASDTAFIEAATVEPAPAAAAAAVSSVPAGWHPDPSKRYEMRYWDGEKWTEYVSSQGQTYTDPPVA